MSRGRRDAPRPGASQLALTTLTALGLTVGSWLAPLAPASAASPALGAPGAVVDFQAPQASGQLGTPLTFSQVFTAPAAPARVELLTEVPGSDTTLVTPAAVSGSGTYTARVTDAEHVLPNTTIRYSFRVIDAAGGTAVGPSGSLTVADPRYAWRVRQGALVRLHWYQGDDAFAARAVSIGDQAVARVSKLLGVTESQPIDFFVYASADGLDGALGPGTSEFVAGRAVPSIRTLFAEIDPGQIGSDWVSTVIPHELTHLVFDTATHNPLNAPPLWLNEGLAVYESEGDDAADQARLRAALASGSILPLTGLAGPFPQRQELFYQSYAEAVSAVSFLVSHYGQPKLVALIRSYAQGVTDDEAFRSATGGDLAAFQAAWLAHIGAPTPPAYGPLAAPPGATPPGWSGPGAAMGPATTPGSGAPSLAPVGGPGAGGGLSSGARGASGLTLDLVSAGGVLVLLFVAGLLLIRRDRRQP